MHSTRPILVSFLPWLPPLKGLGFLKALEATPSHQPEQSPSSGQGQAEPSPFQEGGSCSAVSERGMQAAHLPGLVPSWVTIYTDCQASGTS